MMRIHTLNNKYKVQSGQQSLESTRSALCMVISVRVIHTHTRSSRACRHSEKSFRDCGIHFMHIRYHNKMVEFNLVLSFNCFQIKILKICTIIQWCWCGFKTSTLMMDPYVWQSMTCIKSDFMNQEKFKLLCHSVQQHIASDYIFNAIYCNNLNGMK